MIWVPDTCKCIIDCLAPSIEGTFRQRCKSHNTTLETYAHNKRFKEQEANRRSESEKPQFQIDRTFRPTQ